MSRNLPHICICTVKPSYAYHTQCICRVPKGKHKIIGNQWNNGAMCINLQLNVLHL